VTTAGKRVIPKRRFRTIPRSCCVTPPTNGHVFTGEELKDIGSAIAVAAVPAWSDLAKHTVYHVFNPSTPPFDSEILTGLIGKPRGEQDKPYQNNAVGGIFNWANKRGLIDPVGSTNALDPKSHANDHKLWVRNDKVWISKKPCPHCPGFI
jgi:hypothetical protein